MLRVLPIVLMLFCSFSQAKEVSGLYQARVLVPNQQADSREVGAQQGMLEVLHKVSGFAVDPEHPGVASALSVADQYLYQFSYERAENLPSGESGSWLRMEFGKDSILKIIEQARLPRWGENRPTVLSWIAIDKANSGREVLTDSSNDEYYQALKEAAQRRGLPVVMPIYDLEDSIKLPIEQLWGQFSGPILSASERYDAESVLAARIYQDSKGIWHGKWRFFFAGREYEFVANEETLPSLMVTGLTSAGEVLANAFALKPGADQKGRVSVQINGIQAISDYAKIEQYLDKLAITRSVFVSEVAKDKVFFDLDLSGTLQQLQQTLSLDKRLAPDESTEDERLRGPKLLFFRWQP